MGILQRFEHGEVEALRTGNGLFGDRVNTACIVYRIGNTVIDTGPPNQWRQIRRFLEERRIDQVLVTHHHEDHGGNAGLIRERWKTPIRVHERGVTHYVHGFRLPFYRWLAWGKPRTKFEPEVCPERVALDQKRSLRVLYTPGHADDQVCFLEPTRGWLFSGDVYITRRPKYLRRVEDPNKEIESLRLLLEQSFDTVFCAHRGYVEGGDQAIRDKYDYLVELRERVCALRKRGDSIRAITKKLLGGEEFLFWASLGDFSKRNYIEAFAAFHESGPAMPGPKPDNGTSL